MSSTEFAPVVSLLDAEAASLSKGTCVHVDFTSLPAAPELTLNGSTPNNSDRTNMWSICQREKLIEELRQQLIACNTPVEVVVQVLNAIRQYERLLIDISDVWAAKTDSKAAAYTAEAAPLKCNLAFENFPDTERCHPVERPTLALHQTHFWNHVHQPRLRHSRSVVSNETTYPPLQTVRPAYRRERQPPVGRFFSTFPKSLFACCSGHEGV